MCTLKLTAAALTVMGFIVVGFPLVTAAAPPVRVGVSQIEAAQNENVQSVQVHRHTWRQRRAMGQHRQQDRHDSPPRR